MRNPIAADERAALQFDDVASALDAGLPVTSLGATAADGERAVHAILRTRGITLRAAEDACLAAAVRAGRVPAALRERATQRRARAEVWRRIAAGLAYPALLLVLAIAISLLLAPFYGALLPIALACVILAGLGTAFWCRRGFLYGGDAWLGMPVLGPIAHAFGEIDYLETLHGAYASGIPLLEAHTQATGTVAITGVRLRLRRAEQSLRTGSLLAESLAAAAALHPETAQLLTTGEHAGSLEEAVGRALVRRREVTTRAVTRLAKVLTGTVYGLALAVGAYMVLSFWLQYFARLRG